MPVTTLDKLAPGESGRITRVSGKGAVRRRLVDMGLTSGAVIDMIKTSPLGDPVEYRLRGYHLSLRKSEASTIEVEVIGEGIPSRGWGRSQGATLDLRRVQSGQRVVVTGLRGGLRVKEKLADLGLRPGLPLRMIQNEFAGPMIISVNDENRLVIGRGLARHVLVNPA